MTWLLDLSSLLTVTFWHEEGFLALLVLSPNRGVVYACESENLAVAAPGYRVTHSQQQRPRDSSYQLHSSNVVVDTQHLTACYVVHGFVPAQNKTRGTRASN